MDVREKLVKILKQAPFEGKVLDEWWWEEKIKKIADHLISNSVTVQEWISVDDRLPEEGEYVLCWYEYFRFGPYHRMFQTYGIGYQYNGMWGGEVVQGKKARVLAWIPLPAAPKIDGGTENASKEM